MDKKTILVVEDDDVLRDVLVEKLNVSGYNALGAENGVIGIDKMRSDSPDIVLLDILMPEKNGMQVLEEMSVDPVLKKIPVIVISNSGQPVEVERARSLGARDFLIKAVFDPGGSIRKSEGAFRRDGRE